MIKNMYLVIFTFISLGMTHFSYTMNQANLAPNKKELTQGISSAIDNIMEPKESKSISLHKPIAAPVTEETIKKTKSPHSIIMYHYKEYATMNYYKTC